MLKGDLVGEIMLAIKKNRLALLSAHKEIVLEVRADGTKSLCLMKRMQVQAGGTKSLCLMNRMQRLF